MEASEGTTETAEGTDEGTQGTEGQGQNDALTDLFPDLSELPSEQREVIDPIIQDIQGNVGKKLEEHAGFRKQFEPYGELGLEEYEPDAVGGALGLLDMIANAGDDDEAKEAFQNFLSAAAEDLGMELRDPNSEDGPDDDDDFDPLDDDEGVSEEEIAQMVQNAVQQAISPMMEQQQQQQQEEQYNQAVQSAEQEIDSTLESLHGEYGIESPEDQKKFDAHVIKASMAYPNLSAADAVRKGFEDYKEIRADGGNELFRKVEAQPELGEGSGQPNTSGEPITGQEDVNAAVRSRLRQMNQS